MSYKDHNDIFEVELIEKEIANIDVAEKEFANVELKVIDILNGSALVAQYVKTYYIHNEVPTKITSKKFRLANNYISGTLVVFFNGIKENYIIENSSTDFSFQVDILANDDIEVCYIRA